MHVREILRKENSSTYPVYAILDDNRKIYAKYIDNNEGNLILINEYICYCIASMLKLNIPIYGLAGIDKDTFDENHLLLPENYGACFYTLELENVTRINEVIINKNKDKYIDFYEDMILFDHVIYNKDRNLGNILLNIKNAELYLLDHTHALKNAAIWNKYCFNQGIQDEDYKDNIIMKYNQDSYSCFRGVTKLKRERLESKLAKYSKITEEFLNNTILKIPKEWICCDEEDLQALVRYILYRIKKLEDIIDVIVNFKG